ncbi:MAG: TolC family protein [Chitinispirillaceae bacterium]
MSMKMRFIGMVVAFSTLLGAAPLFATASTDSLHLSLRDVLLKAAQNNPLFRIERIDTEVASTIYRENLYRYEPQIRMSFGSSQQRGDSVRNVQNASVAVTEELPTGTSIQLEGSVGPLSGGGLRPFTVPGEEYENSMSLTLAQPLMRGLSPSANLAPIRTANVDICIRQEELAAYAMKLLADTERAYWDLVLSRREVGIYTHSLELARRLLYESEEKLKVGRIASLDLAVIRAEVATREKQLIDASAAFRQKSLQLIYLMSDSLLWETQLAPKDTAVSLDHADSVVLHLKAAQAHRPDLSLARLLARKGELEVTRTKNGLLPKLDFFITLEGSSYAQSFSDALSRYDEPSGSISGGLTFQMPASNGASRERHRRAVLSSEQIELSLENFSRLMELEVRSAHLEASRALKQIEAAQVARDLQQKKLEAEQEKMNVGKSTEYAVLQAQRDYISADLDEARARVTYMNALLSLYSSDGTLLNRRGIAAYQ